MLSLSVLLDYLLFQNNLQSIEATAETAHRLISILNVNVTIFS